jgi:hypothetical protein
LFLLSPGDGIGAGIVAHLSRFELEDDALAIEENGIEMGNVIDAYEGEKAKTPTGEAPV